ncbi:hypothetical protein D4764_19G0003140 [Takifugu flavidus]|uniref:CCHC-type domain-containing protein n=1 Tax=Takifugu flavidus TaxID=433684 RepID=A0A5C6NN76_9TELE|nr:hypothetical protein D4764_19G0003140 [Takifugu flavidus]
MAANAGLTGLSRKHGVKAVVLFLAKVEQVNMLVETGITVGGQFVQVTPLTQPAARITLSNVPPFISDEFLVRELSRHGKVVSPIRKMLSGYDFDYTLFATSSALKCFNCNEEGHLARACPSRVASDTQAAEPAAPAPVAPPATRPVPAARRRWLSAEGSSAAPDGATAESQMEEKRDECVRESEVSGGSEIVEMVVEMNGESGESGGKVDLTGEVCDLSGVMSEVVCDSNELGRKGEVMGETVELGETGETGDRIQTGEQGTVGQVMGGLDGPGIVAGERGEGEVSTGERGEGEVSTGERVREQCEHRGARKRNKRKSAMKDKGGKTGRLEETVADTDTSDCESMSDGSELSGTTPDGQDFDLYPPGLFKKFLTQTKGMKGLDLGTYFPDRLCFIRHHHYYGINISRNHLSNTTTHHISQSKGLSLLFSSEATTTTPATTSADGTCKRTSVTQH